jgi:radical SAM superfamily enzyme YgiQ (UPF0313 family)
MNFYPIDYIEPVFRPPSEAQSFILPLTNGCSWNKCTFCEMYTQEQKKFRARKEEEVFADIECVAKVVPQTRRVFLADGDAMILPTRRLKLVLEKLQASFPNVERITSYCLPRNLAKKTTEELKELKALGLDMLYVGLESGDDFVLDMVNKGETFESSVSALKKIRDSGIRSSVMVLNGLGGQRYSEQHVLNSAKAVNSAQPDYVSTLVVSFPMGEERYRERFIDWEPLNQRQLFKELRTFIGHLELENTVFRSDHASNYLPLKGVLGKDKARLLSELDTAIHQPEKVSLRQEWQRGL